jgi:hypothetical protein
MWFHFDYFLNKLFPATAADVFLYPIFYSSNNQPKRLVIPAQAGIHTSLRFWIPHQACPERSRTGAE